MSNTRKIVALVGTYRRGGITDAAVEEILAAACEEGAETLTLYLSEQEIAFCTNCRTCTQQPGTERGDCVIDDDLAAVLTEVESADALVLASPTNFGTVTALTKRFIERLIGTAYWPWGTHIPKPRKNTKTKAAVVVASSGAPAILGRYLFPIVKLLKQSCELLDARVIGVLFIGLSAKEPHPKLSKRNRKRARRLGVKLARYPTPPPSD